MSETRLEKYKKYRQSVNEFNAINKEPQSVEQRRTSIVNDKTNTTSTLPLEEVLGQIEEPQEDNNRRVFTKKMIAIGILSTVGLILVAFIIVFAIMAFGGGNQ